MRVPRTTVLVAALALVAAGLLAGCASSGPSDPSSASQAVALLRETFSGTGNATSGDIELALKVIPTGSSDLTAPITIGFGGPFQNGAKGTLPQSDFAVSVAAQGHTGKLSIISTGSAGYVTVGGVSYKLPAATYRKLESGVSSVSGASSSASSASTLTNLGIDPLKWITSPRVVGQATVGGARTTQITAKVNVVELLKSLGKLAGKASSLGVKDASKLGTGLTSAEQSKLAAEIKSPSFEVWTGSSDHTLRKLAVGATIPVSGSLRTSLGGLSSVRVSLTLQYRDLNQPQTIAAPTHTQPYSEFEQKIAALLASVGAGGAQSRGSGTGTTSSGTSVSGADKRYINCIVKAAGNVTKEQKCGALLGG